MDRLQLADWFSFPSLLAAGGWALSSLMTVHGLHLAQKRTIRSVVYAMLCFVVFVATLTLGAMQHRDGRGADTKSQDTLDGIKDIKLALGANDTAKVGQVLKDAANKIVDLQRQVTALQNPPQNPDRLYQEGSEVAYFYEGQISTDGKKFEFVEVYNAHIDFSKPIRFRQYDLSCAPTPIFAGFSVQIGLGAVNNVIKNVPCVVLDRAN